MKFTPPTKENKAELTEKFERTHNLRRNTTVKSGNVLDEYPRLIDMPELVSLLQAVFQNSLKIRISKKAIVKYSPRKMKN